MSHLEWSDIPKESRGQRLKELKKVELIDLIQLPDNHPKISTRDTHGFLLELAHMYGGKA